MTIRYLLSCLILAMSAGSIGDQALAQEPLAESVSAAEAPVPAPLPPPGEMARCKQLIDSGLYIAARARLEPIVEQHPGWARATSLLALTYYRENRFEPAKVLFAKALEADPDEIAVRPLYGWTLYSLGELDEARATFEELLESKPDYTAAHYALGMIHLDSDEIVAARQLFETIVTLASEQEDAAMEGRAHGRLGELYVRVDDLPSAKRELELAIVLFPDDHEALFRLSRVLQRLGDDEGAEVARNKYREAKERNQPVVGRRPG